MTRAKAGMQKLRKLLIDKNMKKQVFRNATGISSASMAKRGKGENVTTDVLLRICDALRCDISEIVERIPEDTH